MRATPQPLIDQHPDHTFVTAPLALRQWGADAGLFHDGTAQLRGRYAELGLTDLLPLDRVHIAVHSTRTGAFGGFHHPDQGYRHLQMRAIVTMYGDMTADGPASPALAALDLLRAYAHDCLHYGSARTYQMREDAVVRTQYGVNFRRTNGRTYSAPDMGGTTGTRNLGVVMEGACDREARALTRRIASQHRVTADSGVDGYALRDVTGQLTTIDTPSGLCNEQTAYLTSMAKYEAEVDVRYADFLAEIGGAEQEDLHSLILASMISGDLAPLCLWLDQRHGPGAFTALFMSPLYFGGMVLAS